MYLTENRSVGDWGRLLHRLAAVLVWVWNWQKGPASHPNQDYEATTRKTYYVGLTSPGKLNAWRAGYDSVGC